MKVVWKWLHRAVLLLFFYSALAVAQVDTSRVKEKIEAFIGSPNVVKSVTLTPYSGLYEVVLTSGELIYTDVQGSFFIDGRIIDTKTRRDVTQERLGKLSAIDFSALPFNQAIKMVRGNGKRVIATFEDPNCSYCKRLLKELRKLDDVTVYTFLYPVLGPASAETSKAIWCSKDRAQAWLDWMNADKEPIAVEKCDDSAVSRNMALGRQFNINGVPVLFFKDGSRMSGYLLASELDKILNERN